MELRLTSISEVSGINLINQILGPSFDCTSFRTANGPKVAVASSKWFTAGPPEVQTAMKDSKRR